MRMEASPHSKSRLEELHMQRFPKLKFIIEKEYYHLDSDLSENSLVPHVPHLSIHRQASLYLIDPYSASVSHLSLVINI